MHSTFSTKNLSVKHIACKAETCSGYMKNWKKKVRIDSRSPLPHMAAWARFLCVSGSASTPSVGADYTTCLVTTMRSYRARLPKTGLGRSVVKEPTPNSQAQNLTKKKAPIRRSGHFLVQSAGTNTPYQNIYNLLIYKGFLIIAER